MCKKTKLLLKKDRKFLQTPQTFPKHLQEFPPLDLAQVQVLVPVRVHLRGKDLDQLQLLHLDKRIALVAHRTQLVAECSH